MWAIGHGYPVMQYFLVENSLVDDLDDWPAHLEILFDIFRHFVLMIRLPWVPHSPSALKLERKVYVFWTADMRQMPHFSFLKVNQFHTEISVSKKGKLGKKMQKTKLLKEKKLFNLFVNKFIPAYVVLGNVSIMFFSLLSGHFQRWSRYN